MAKGVRPSMALSVGLVLFASLMVASGHPSSPEGAVVITNPTSGPVRQDESGFTDTVAVDAKPLETAQQSPVTVASSTAGGAAGGYVNTEKLVQQSARQIEEAIERSEHHGTDGDNVTGSAPSTAAPSKPSINPVIETTTQATKPMKDKVSLYVKKAGAVMDKPSMKKFNAKTTLALPKQALVETVRTSATEAAVVSTTTTATTSTTTSTEGTTTTAATTTTTTEMATTPSTTTTTSSTTTTTTTTSAAPSTPAAAAIEDVDEVGAECVAKISLPTGYKLWRTKDKNTLNLTLATDNLSCTISAGLSVSSNTTSHLVLDAQVGDQIRLFVDEVDDDALVTLHRSQEDALTECVEPPHGSVVWNRSRDFVIEAELLTQSGLQFFAVAVQSNNVLRVWHMRISVYDSECEPRKSSGELCSARGICALAPGESTYACHCCSSVKGRTCDEFDACAVNPCRNKGFCVDISEGLRGNLYQCLCPHAFRGMNCEQNADFCEMHRPCKNNATCVSAPPEASGTAEYTCECPRGFEGPNCEVNIDECESKPCVHGMCEDGVGEFKCYCLPGYGGELCEFEYDECDSSPCINSGACEDLIAGYKCHCGPGYTGRRCETKVDLCRPNPCLAPATCIDRGNNYTCVCQGSGCATRDQQDPCYPNPCQHGGSCWPSMDNFYCSCPPGFAGDNCEEIAYPQAIAERRVYNPEESRQPSSERLHSIYVACATVATICALVAIVATVCQCRLSRPSSAGDHHLGGGGAGSDSDCEHYKGSSRTGGHLRGPAFHGDKLQLPWQRF